MKQILLIWLLLPLLGFGQGRSVTIISTDIVLERVDTGFDLEAPGNWFIQFNEKRWVKLGKTLYPVKADRTRAVIDAQDAVKSNLDTYVIQAVQGGHYTQREGSGLTLNARTIFSYIAVDIELDKPIKIYVRYKNKQYDLILYPDPADENAAATTAKANIMTELGIIELTAKTDGFFSD